MVSELETNVVAVERVSEYTKVPTEVGIKNVQSYSCDTSFKVVFYELEYSRIYTKKSDLEILNYNICIYQCIILFFIALS